MAALALSHRSHVRVGEFGGTPQKEKKAFFALH
jgi:hypothetical protein